MDAVTGPTIQLSSLSNLDTAPIECYRLRAECRKGWKSWKANIDDLESQGKRVLNSYSIAFHVGPPCTTAISTRLQAKHLRMSKIRQMGVHRLRLNTGTSSLKRRMRWILLCSRTISCKRTNQSF